MASTQSRYLGLVEMTYDRGVMEGHPQELYLSWLWEYWVYNSDKKDLGSGYEQHGVLETQVWLGVEVVVWEDAGVVTGHW
jgi:hypothetical protein